MNEQRRIGKYIIDKCEIIGTGCFVYEAWMPTNLDEHSHSTITTIDGAWYGRIGTDPNHNYFEKLPAMSDERYSDCKLAYFRRYKLAYRLIELAFPEAKAMIHDAGQIIS